MNVPGFNPGEQNRSTKVFHLNGFFEAFTERVQSLETLLDLEGAGVLAEEERQGLPQVLDVLEVLLQLCDLFTGLLQG